MLMHEVSRQARLAAKTIRYYESIGLMPPPRRAPNNYRLYVAADVERLRFIASARRLGLRLADVSEILASRDQGIAPCTRVLAALDQCRVKIDRRLADLLALRELLLQLQRDGAIRPLDDVEGQACVCALVTAWGQAGEAKPERGGLADDPEGQP